MATEEPMEASGPRYPFSEYVSTWGSVDRTSDEFWQEARNHLRDGAMVTLLEVLYEDGTISGEAAIRVLGMGANWSANDG